VPPNSVCKNPVGVGERQVRLLDDRPHALESLYALPRDRADLRLRLQEAEIGRPGDAQAVHTAVDAAQEIGGIARKRQRVSPMRASHCAEHQRGIANRSRDRPCVQHQLVGRGRRIDRHPPECRLQSHQAAEAGRDADRTRAVTAQRQRREPGRDCGRRAAARSAGRAREIPGISRRAEQRVVGASAPSELRRVGLADVDRAGGLQPLDRGRILGRHKMLQQPGAGRMPHPAHPIGVLDRNRNAMKRAQRIARHHRMLGPAGGLPCALRMERDECVEARVQAIDP
jgi:hypothetical protein